MTSLPSDMSKIWEALQTASPSEDPSIITHVPRQIRVNSIVDPLPDEIFNNEPWYITEDSIRDTLPGSITPVTTSTTSTTTSESNLWFFNPVTTITTIPSSSTITTTTANTPELDLEDVLKTIVNKFASMNSDIESDEHRYDESDYSVIVDGIHDIYEAVKQITNIIENNNL